MNAQHATVAQYYDEATPDYLQHVGDVLQGAMMTGAPFDSAPQRTLDFIAREAGLADGQHVLDAGCGVCGPAVYFARLFPSMRIKAVTISPVQFQAALGRIWRAGVELRIKAVLGDMHDLEDDGVFDRVLFLESAGHSQDRPALWSMAHRALKPGGILYIKDVMLTVDPCATTQEQADDLRTFNGLYAYNTYSQATVVDELKACGFGDIAIKPLWPMLDSARAEHCKRTDGELNAFGKRHAHELPNLPAAFFQVSARK